MISELLLEAAETAAEETPKQTNWGSIIIMGALILLLVGFLIWQNISNKKKQKQAEESVRKLKVGDRVKTIGGICGFVAEINDKENTFVLETGLVDKKSYVKFDKGAIYQTAPADGYQSPEPNAVEEAPAEEPVEAPAEQPVEEVSEEDRPAKRDEF